MGTKNNPSRFDCMAKAEPDEPYFVLLGRDRSAAKLVREWATQRHAEGDTSGAVMEALGIANDMDKFSIEYHARVTPPVLPQENE